MNALKNSFEFKIADGSRSLILRKDDHVRLYPTLERRDSAKKRGFGELLSNRQVDLLRIATAVHVADGWVKRLCETNGYRSPVLDIEVLDPVFWVRSDTLILLKTCVNFLSGGDDWDFRFRPSPDARHNQQRHLFRAMEPPPVVSLYSGGLDSVAGLAARLAAMPGRIFRPVTVRHQMQREKLVGDHFEMLVEKALTTANDLQPFQVGAFIKNKQIHRELVS